MRLRDQAICLRTSDFSETSQVAHFFTRTGGVVHVLAKGAKRAKSKTGGAIDLLSEGELVYISSRGEALATLVEFSETTPHTHLRRDAGRLNTSLYMIELVHALLGEADPHPEVFDLLHNALLRMAAEDAPVEAVLAYFQWRCLKLAGLLGDLRRCVSCGSDALPSESHAGGASKSRPGRNLYFSSAQGGLLCSDCELTATEKYLLDSPTLAGIRVLTAVAGGAKLALPSEQARGVNRLLAYHVQQQLGKPLAMARFVMPRSKQG